MGGEENEREEMEERNKKKTEEKNVVKKEGELRIIASISQ